MRISNFSVVVAVTLCAFTLCAQQPPATLKNFKNLPPGQYQQISQAYRDGKPFGQPVTDTHCAAPLSPQGAQATQQMQAAVAPTCSTKVTIDTSNQGEWLQTCDPGVMQTLIRSTFKRVDDRTVTLDTNMTKGGQQLTNTHSTLKYLGACPAGTAQPQLSTMPKPSDEDCAQLPEMREQAKAATVESCHTADFPPAYVARCEASMKMLKQHMQQLETACKR